MHTSWFFRLIQPNLNRLRLGVVLALLCLASATQAQISGSKAIPGDYATIAAAITALNMGGVGTGGVTFNVAAGHTEISTPAVLTATGTAAAPIVFQKAGSGANPLVTAVAGSGTGTLDGVIRLSGTDYCTFDGIDLSDVGNAAGTVTQQMEFGYALFRTSATNGCQNNVIRNCTITLNKAYVSTIGIWVANTGSGSTTVVSASSAAGTHSNNKLDGNTITSFVGIYLFGTNSTTLANNDTGNEVGSTAGNTMSNIGGSDTPAYGIRAEHQTNLKIENNSVSIPTGNTASTVRGIATGVSTPGGIRGAILLNNNTVTIASATTSSVWGIHQAGNSITDVQILNNKVRNMSLTGNAVVVNGIENAASSSAITKLYLNGNEVSGNSTATANTFNAIFHSGTSMSGTVDFRISNNSILNNTRSGSNGTAANNLFHAIRLATSGSAYPVTVASNIISGNQITGNNGTFYGVLMAKNIPVLSNNVVSNNSIPNTSGTAASALFAYHNLNTSAIQETLTDNTVTGFSIGGTSSASTHTITGFFSESASGTIKTHTGNTFGGFSIGTGAGTIYGIHTIKGSPAVYSYNKVYDFSATGAASLVTGIFADGTNTTAMRVVNNLVGDLRAPAATSAVAVAGIALNGNSTSLLSVQHNTIYLSDATTTSTSFGSSALYLISGNAPFDLRNNIFINTSVPGSGSGHSLALRLISTINTRYSTSSNNNLFYAGPGPRQALYGEGAGATPANVKTVLGPASTAGTFQAYVTASRESASVSGLPAFLSTTGSAATFLHINPAGGELLESAGTVIDGLTDDYDGDIRAGSPGYPGTGTAPDIGADEFVTPVDMLPVALLAPVAGGCFSGSEEVVVQVRNNAPAPINFGTRPLTVSVVVTAPGYPAQNLSTTIDTGILAASATQDITLPAPVQLAAGVAYTFTITTTIAGDNTPGNDQLITTRTVSSIAPEAALTNNGPACTGNTAVVSIALSGSGPWTFTYTDGSTSTTVTATSTTPYLITTPVLSADVTYSLTALSGPSCPATAGALAAATTTISVNTTTTFTGAVDSDWHTAGNWTHCVPTALVSALIPTGRAVTLSSGTGTANNLSIEGSATLTVAGAGTALDLKGSFTTATAASYVALAGTTLFSGSTAQPVPAATYHHLTLLGSGATAKVLAGAIMVNGDLDLSAGMLTQGNFDVTMGAGSGSVLGASAAHFLVQNGNGRLCFNAVGAAQRPQAVFPIGSSASSYTPATVANAGTPDQLCAHVASGVSRQGNAVTSNVVNKTWRITEGTPGGSDATLTLQWNASDELNGFNRSLAGIAQYQNDEWNAACFTCFGPAGGSDPYALARTGLSSFGPFAVQDAAKPLPVELSRFEAVRLGSTASLSWHTASEQRNQGFEVQVSVDGREFRPLGFVAATSPSSASPRSYRFTDQEPGKQGLRYYRLRQLDLDGTANFSPVRTLTFDAVLAAGSLRATPNPFQGQLTLVVQAGTAQPATKLSLTDATGRTVLQQPVALSAGLSHLLVPGLERLPQGVYIVHLPIDGQVHHLKVHKQ